MPKPSPTRIPLELTVGQVAERSGVAVSALHFYESKGLIRSWRNQGNQRRYPREVLRRIAVIKVAQRAGIPVVPLPFTVGGSAKAKDLFGLFDDTIERLLAANK